MSSTTQPLRRRGDERRPPRRRRALVRRARLGVRRRDEQDDEALFGYALDLAAPSGDSTVPQALKAGVVNYVDAFRGCMCGGIKAVPIVETLAPFGAALQRLLRGAEGDDSLIWADFLPALQSSLKSLFRKLLSPAGGVCGGPCADLGGKAFDLSLSFEQTANEFLSNEEDLNYIRDAVKSFTESSLFQESGALRDVWAQLPNDLTIDALLRTPFFYTPSNLRATYDAWGSCACSSEISFDPLLDAVFEDLVVPLIRDQFNFALGQRSDDFQPLLEKLVPYLLGPQLLCGGKCKAAFGSTLASIFDVRSARAFLRDADLFLGLSLDPILSGFLGDSNGENINLGGLARHDRRVDPRHAAPRSARSRRASAASAKPAGRRPSTAWWTS